MANEIPVAFHNGSNYDYHFLTKELANESNGTFECLEENAEKYQTFSFPIEKEAMKFDKNGNESVVTVPYKIKFVDAARFMATSLSNLVDNLTEGIHKSKYQDCDCFLEYESVKDNLIKYKCTYCSEDYSNKTGEKLKKRFKNTFKFTNNDINKFCCKEKVFLLMSTWINGKNLMKYHCLKKKNLKQVKYGRYYRCRLHACKKSLQRI